MGRLVAMIQQHWQHLTEVDKALVLQYCGVHCGDDSGISLEVWMK